MKPIAAPLWIAEVELADSLLPSGVRRQQRPGDRGARVLVRLHRELLGFVSLPTSGDEFRIDAFGAAVRAQLADPLRRHLEADGLAMPAALPTEGLGGWGACARLPDESGEPITIVVCTRNNPTMLAMCLGQLRRLHYRNFEVVVVDNAPSTPEAQVCFSHVVGDDPRFRYVREPTAGLSRARNRGMSEARARYVAFTDDDVHVDPWWLDGVAAGFGRDPRAGCVTGLVPPAELEHAAQQYFDRRYTWASHMEGRVYDLTSRRDSSPLYPYSAGIFGTGANFAVDRRLLDRLGGFDEALGAGTRAGGGEDLDIFVRVLLSGRSLVYEPSAIVWHLHRADHRAMRRQLFYYGAGLTAFLTKYVTDGRTRGEILARAPEGFRRLRRVWNGTGISGRPPATFIAAELLGLAAGPLAYLGERRRLERASASPVEPMPATQVGSP